MSTRSFWAATISAILVVSCATASRDGLTGQRISCPEGERPLLDCSITYEQFARTLRFDLGIVKETIVGVGLGAESLISLDSVTGDLLAHQRQVCIEYNNCFLSVDDFKQEMHYLRRAQMKVREAAGTANMLYGGYEGSQRPFPLGISTVTPEKETDTKYEDESKQAVQDDLDQVNRMLSEAKRNKDAGASIPSKAPPQGALKPIKLQYTLYTQSRSDAKKPFQSGSTLRSGDKLKVSFVTDRPGYVYIINFDPHGNANVIFPHPHISISNEVQAGKVYELPPDNWYYLDNSMGEELIYLVSTPFKINNLDDLITHLEGDNASHSKKLSTVRMKGILVGLTQGKDFRNENGMTAVKVSFMHE